MQFFKSDPSTRKRTGAYCWGWWYAKTKTSLEPAIFVAIYIWVAIGGAIGTAGRYFLSGAVARLIGEAFPWGTLIINVTGCFAIGFFATLTGPNGRYYVGSTGRQFFMTGIFGGYTTFSSFSLQTLNLANNAEWFPAGANIGGSVVLCLLAVWAGSLLANTITALEWI